MMTIRFYHMISLIAVIATQESAYSQEITCGDIKITQLTSTSSDEGGARYSPDGKKIAYHTGQPGQRDIQVMDLSSKDISVFQSTESDEAYPAWAPDGQTIAFVSNQSGQPEIWKKSGQQGQPIQITSTPKGAFFPDWSPDGSLIAFTRLSATAEVPYSSDEGHIWLSTVDGSSSFSLTRRGGEWYPRWSIDGKSILHYGNGGVVALDLDSHQYQFILSAADGFRADRSPGSDWVVFTRTPGDHDGNQDLWLTHVDGRVHQAINITNSSSIDDQADFAPDGKEAIITRNENGQSDLWIIDLRQCENEPAQNP